MVVGAFFLRASGEMQGVLSMVASGQATAGGLVLGSASVAIAQHCHRNTNGVVAVSRKPFWATLDIVSTRSVAISRFDSRHSIPLGKRLRRPCLRVSALQQSTSAKSDKWVLDPVGEYCGFCKCGSTLTLGLHTAV